MLKNKHARYIIEYNSSATYTTVKPYIICEVNAIIFNKKYRGVGIAKQGRHDKWNEKIGREIAHGRAIKDIIDNSDLMTIIT